MKWTLPIAILMTSAGSNSYALHHTKLIVVNVSAISSWGLIHICICICIYPGIVRMSKVGEGIDKLWGRAAVKSKVKHCPGTVGCGAFIHEKVLYMYSPCPWPSPCGTYSRLFLTQAKGCRPDVEAFERSFPFCSHKLCNAITKSVCQSALFTCIILR